MDWYDWVAQGVGLLGTLAYLVSFQIRKQRTFFLVQSLAGLLFTVNMYMLGAYTGCLLNFGNVIRSVFIVSKNEKMHHPVFLVLVELYFIAVTVFTFNGFPSIIGLIPQLVSSAVMWYCGGKAIRMTQLFLNSPCWLTHNIIVGSIGGVLCEIINIISTVVSLIRFRRTGYEEMNKTE